MYGKIAAFALLGTFLVSPALADSWAAPKSGVYGCGHYAVRLIVNSGRSGFTSEITMFSLDRKNREKVHWKQKLDYIPADIHVSDRGWTVGVNEYARLGYNHALVIWNPEGERLADYRLDELLTADELSKYTSQSVSSRWWDEELEFLHDGYKGTFDFLFLTIKQHNRCWSDKRVPDKTITVDLRSGRVWPDFRRSDNDCDYPKRQHEISMNRARFDAPAVEKSGENDPEVFSRLYARRNQNAREWELFLDCAGNALLRAKRQDDRYFRVPDDLMDELSESIRQADFANLPETIRGPRGGGDIKSCIIEQNDKHRGVTKLSARRDNEDNDPKETNRFRTVWRIVQSIVDHAEM